MTDSINIQPPVLDVAINTEKILTISGRSSTVLPARSGYRLEWFDADPAEYALDQTLQNMTKRRTSQERVYSSFTVRRGQPFSIYCQVALYELLQYSMQMGLKSEQTGKEFRFNCSRLNTGQAWSIDFNDIVVLGPAAAGPLEGFEISSDGAFLYFTKTGGLVYQAAIPEETSDLRIFFLIVDVSGRLHNVNIITSESVEVVDATTAVLTFVPDSSGLAVREIPGNPNQLGIRALPNGTDRTLIARHPSNSEVTASASIRVSSLFLRPVQNVNIVQSGQQVQFETNGEGGVLSASSGFVVDSDQLIWQAFEEGVATITYTIGEYSADFLISVIPEVSVRGVVDGYYEIPLAQGEMIQLERSLPYGAFRCVNYPEAVSPSGLVIAVASPTDRYFGKKELEVEYFVEGIVFSFIIEVLPMYPTPDVGGVISQTWIQNVRDYLPVNQVTVGGKKEARNENPQGVITWEIEYSNLRQVEGDCLNVPQEARFNFDRLDRFYNMVTTTDYFSLRDYHTGELFKFVTFNSYAISQYERYKEQGRSVELYYDGGDVQL